MAYEPALRRSDFRPGTLVRLADGRSWTFPAPPGDLESDLEGFGPEYRAILAAIVEAEDLPERRRGELVLAVELLGRNYDLRPDQLRELLDRPSGGEEARRLQQAFADLAAEHLQRARGSRAPEPTARPTSRWGRLLEALSRLARPRRPVDPGPLSMTSRMA